MTADVTGDLVTDLPRPGDRTPPPYGRREVRAWLTHRELTRGNGRDCAAAILARKCPRGTR